MKIIAIKEMSAGNETVGEMWQETKLFEHDTPLMEIIKWAGLKKRVTISLPDNEHDEYFEQTKNDVVF